MALRSTGILTLALLGGSAAFGADIDAGKAKEQQACAECHELGDFKGQSEPQLHAKISDIVAGKIKHKKKLQLSDVERANIAAYLASTAK